VEGDGGEREHAKATLLNIVGVLEEQVEVVQRQSVACEGEDRLKELKGDEGQQVKLGSHFRLP
jgi:hypothetical protein